MKRTTLDTLLLSVFTLAIIFVSSCTGKMVPDPPNPNEEELITTVELTFTDTAQTSNQLVFRFADPDGEGGNAPTETDTIRLSANTVYSLAVRFLDESSSDVEDITVEVKEEDAEHLVCYTTEAGTTLTITDMDGNNLPLGLSVEVVTTNAETGSFTIALKHQPDVKNGSCDVGETDVEVNFAYEVN